MSTHAQQLPYFLKVCTNKEVVEKKTVCPVEGIVVVECGQAE